jgi:hypothetical protein
MSADAPMTIELTPQVRIAVTETQPAVPVQAAPRSTVSLVIPAKNEARNLPYVLAHLPAGIDEVIIVDGRSRDVSCLAARIVRPDVRILTQPYPGKGWALRVGFAAARGDVIVAMDADGSMAPEEIPGYVYLLDHGYDFVKGSRFVSGGGSLDITALRKLGNRGLLTTANWLFKMQWTDLCYGFFAFRRCFLTQLDLHAAGFEVETEITVRAAVTGMRIAEIPSLELPRRSGRTSLRTFHDGQRVLRTLLEQHAQTRRTERTVASQTSTPNPSLGG